MPLLLIAALLITTFFPDVVSAQGLVASCEGASCSACNLVELANNVIKWLVGTLFLVFGVLAVIAGVKLVVSGGNPGAKQDAKNSLTNAFIGLFIVLGAWILIDTLMRFVLSGNDGSVQGFGPWSEIQCGTQVTPAMGQLIGGDPDYDPNPPPPPATNPGGGPFTPSTACTGGACKPLTIPCARASSCTISPDMVDRLDKMYRDANVSGSRVTEAMPPSRVHKSKCHTEGRCIDFSKQGGMTAAEVKRVIEAANKNGLRPVYEVKTQAEKNRLVAGGAPEANIKVLGDWISAPHFSIYGY